MYTAVGDLLSDITNVGGTLLSGGSVTVTGPGGAAPPPGSVPTSGPQRIYCPEQAALMATAATMYPNNDAQQIAYLLTHGPGFATPGGWAGWCALQAQAKQAPPPMPQPMPMTATAISTPATTSHWTTYAAIGAGVLGLAGLVWYLKK